MIDAGILEAIADAVITTDARGHVASMNPAAETLTGCRIAAARGEPLHRVLELVNESTRERVDPGARALSEARAIRFDEGTAVVGRDGTRTAIEGHAAPLRDVDGRPAGTVLVFRDMGEERKEQVRRAALYDLEQDARTRAELASHQREELLAVVSHDLRNPLSSIVTATAVLQGLGASDETSERAQKFIAIISRAAATMNLLVGDLLDLASMESGTFAVTSTPQEVAPILRESIDIFSPLATSHGLRFECAVDGAGVWMHCDAARVSQVLSNLIGNAIKFTPQGGIVRVDVETIGAETRFTIRDTGPGIPEDHLQHIFDRYWRARRERRTGIGLGLSIAKGLVEAQGGRIWVESRVGKGTAFFFTLRSAQATFVAAAVSQPSGPDAETGRAQPRKRRLLVVDDDRELRESLCEFLEEAGYDVIGVKNGVEAMEQLQAEEKPDLILLDLMMPGMSGWQFHEQQRQDVALESIPIVVMTSSRDLKGLPAGGGSVVYKPLRLEQLLRTIARATASSPERAARAGASR